MDFVVGLPRSPKGNNAIRVIVNRLTKSAHYIPFRVDNLQKHLQRSTCKKQLDYMESLLVLFQIETLDLCHVSGIVFRGALAAS